MQVQMYACALMFMKIFKKSTFYHPVCRRTIYGFIKFRISTMDLCSKYDILIYFNKYANNFQKSQNVYFN